MKALIVALFALIAALPARAEVAIQEVTSPGGIHAWLVEDHEIPFTALEIRFRGGTSLDAPGKRGVVNLMTGLLEEGAGDLDARGFAEAREALAASLSFRAYDDALSVSAKLLTENRDAGLALLREALVAPRFDEDAIERVRAQVLSSLRSRETDPSSIAGRAFDALAWGDHPYGSQGSGTIESVTALTRADLLAAWKGAMARDRIYVSAVGDITAQELGAALDGLLAGLPEVGVPMPGDVAFQADGGVSVEPFDTPQSVIYFGHSGIGVDDPDFFAAYLLNTIMGGGNFNSRLMDELRVKRGLTYGVSSYLMDADHADAMIGVVKSENAKAGQVVELLRSEWARMGRDGVTEAELAEAKTFLTGAYPLRFDGNGPIAQILVGMQMEGYTPDYINTRNAQIEAVTLEGANRVAARLYRAEDLRFVVVGQPEGLTGE